MRLRGCLRHHFPGLPPVTNKPTVAPGPRPRLRHWREDEAVPRRSVFDDSQALELDADDLLDTLEADAATAATAQPVASAKPVVADVTRMKSMSLPPPVVPLDTPTAIAALASADDAQSDRRHLVALCKQDVRCSGVVQRAR